MTNYTTPYKDLESSPFSKEDIKYIHHLFYDENKSKAEIKRITGLTYHLVGRAISSIESGVFNEEIYENLITIDDDFEDEFGNTINIYDGISIEIHNHYESEPKQKSKKKKKKVTQSKLSKWSKRVRERDNHTCSVCGKYDKQHMEAHHLKPKSIYPDEALDELNGVCICQRCHRRYNEKYSPKNQNSVTFTRFIFEENKGI